MAAAAPQVGGRRSAFDGSGARGAELKQVTLNAWDQYLHRAEERARGRFLWADETAERARRVRAGEVVVLGNTPEAVPAGLIHHWTGAAFVAGARMDDVMAVVRDYERYTEYYKPSVVDARTLSKERRGGRGFTVVVVDKAMFHEEGAGQRVPVAVPAGGRDEVVERLSRRPGCRKWRRRGGFRRAKGAAKYLAAGDDFAVRGARRGRVHRDGGDGAEQANSDGAALGGGSDCEAGFEGVAHDVAGTDEECDGIAGEVGGRIDGCAGSPDSRIKSGNLIASRRIFYR